MQTNTGVRRLRAEALVARGLRAPDEDCVSRKDLAKAAREAMEALQLKPSARLVLGELVGCYGEQKLERGLLVWPSNAYLARRTGLTERSIRRAVICLTQSKLIEPVDSANRKRFAIRSSDGVIIAAFGFNLSPVYAQRAEFAGMLLERQIKSQEFARQHDELTICRKAIEEALRALATHFPEILISEFEMRLGALIAQTPSRRTHMPVETLLTLMRNLRAEVEDTFQQASKELEESAYARRPVSLIETDNDQSSDACIGLGEEVPAERQEDIPLSLVLDACPALKEHLTAPIGSYDDLITAGKFLRGSIGAHLDAWHEAVLRLDKIKAAMLVLYVLQIHSDDVTFGQSRIKNPGGLFRSLVRRLAARDFDLKVEFQALRRRHMT